MNKATIFGRIGQQPETKPVGETSITEFSVATSQRVKRDSEYVDETTWHNVKFWGKQGEVIAKFFDKGSQILLSGRIENRNYTDKDGNKRIASSIVGDSFHFVDKMEKRNDPPVSSDWHGADGGNDNGSDGLQF